MTLLTSHTRMKLLVASQTMKMKVLTWMERSEELTRKRIQHNKRIRREEGNLKREALKQIKKSPVSSLLKVKKDLRMEYLRVTQIRDRKKRSLQMVKQMNMVKTQQTKMHRKMKAQSLIKIRVGTQRSRNRRWSRFLMEIIDPMSEIAKI